MIRNLIQTSLKPFTDNFWISLQVEVQLSLVRFKITSIKFSLHLKDEKQRKKIRKLITDHEIEKAEQTIRFQ